jgi:hypothetical protein
MATKRLVLSVFCTFFAVISAFAAAGEHVKEPGLSATQIVEKNVAARGGAEAWRKIQTMVWVGHVESASAVGSALPFVLEMKRPNKTRFQITAFNQVAVHVFDGAHGWKLRSTHGAKPDVQPFTEDEVNYAKNEQVIDGPLIDLEAKGISVSLDGVDDVEGRKAYRLSVRNPSGMSHHIWIDAQTFLDIKYDRITHNAMGQTATVSVFYRNYQSIEGLQIPLVIESSASTTPSTNNKLVIEKLSLNPALEDGLFAKPGGSGLAFSNSIGVGALQSREASRHATGDAGWQAP